MAGKVPSDMSEMYSYEEDTPSIDIPSLPDEHDVQNLMQMLERVEIDPQELERIEGDLYLPSGTYIWNRGNVTVSDPRAIVADSQPGDVFGTHGRCMIDAYGPVLNMGTQKTGQFRFSFSPDTRIGKDGERPDPWSQNYGRFTRLYFLLNERRARKPGEILALVKGGQYQMYITLSKQGQNFLNQVKPL